MPSDAVISGALMTLGANLLLQATLVLAAGWGLEKWVRQRGCGPWAAVWAQRATLVGLVLIPVGTLVSHALNRPGILYVSLPEPVAETGGVLASAGWLYLVVSAVWFLGAVLGLSWLALGVMRARRWTRAARPADVAWRHRVLRQAEASGVSASTRHRLMVAVSTRVESPCLVGLRKPVLLLPAARLAACDDAVLLHELTHLRRADNLWGLATLLLRASLWVHPLTWRLHRAHRTAIEEACDDAVLAELPNPAAYVKSLLAFATARPVPVAVPVATLFGSRQELLGRTRRLLSRTETVGSALAGIGPWTRLGVVAGLGLVMIGASLLAVHHTSTVALAGYAWLWCAG